MCLRLTELRPLITFMVQRDRVPPSEQFMFQNNRTSPSDHFHDSGRRSSAVWTGFFERTTSASPCVGRKHWAVRPRLGAVLKRSSQAAFRLSDLLFPGRTLQDWARHRSFDHISQAAGGQFGLAKFALWRDSISPGQAVCSHWIPSTSYSISSSGPLNYEVRDSYGGELYNYANLIALTYPFRVQAGPVLLQRMTNSRQGKPEKEFLIQRKMNWFDDQKSAFL